MRVLCINDQNKPAQIPQEQWVKAGKQYTVTQIIALPLQPGKTGFLLKEVSLSPECFPYEFYSSERFAEVFETEREAVEALEEEFAI
jgi:hypothetical protein